MYLLYKTVGPTQYPVQRVPVIPSPREKKRSGGVRLTNYVRLWVALTLHTRKAVPPPPTPTPLCACMARCVIMYVDK